MTVTRWRLEPAGEPEFSHAHAEARSAVSTAAQSSL
jgi:hypothetical protein